MIPKILLSVLLIMIIVYTLYVVYKSEEKEAFENKYLNLQNVSGNKEGFVSGQCPTTMIKKGNQILLYNPKMAKIPGVNPIVLKSLKEYKDYIKWQRANKLNCPILHLERMYDTQGNENYEIKNSFLLDNPSGPLNHDLPNVKKTPNLTKLLNAHEDNNYPYNKHSYPAYDPHNQYVGTMTTLDKNGFNPQTNL